MSEHEHEDVNGHLADASGDEATAYRVALRVLRAASPLNRKTCPTPAELTATDLVGDTGRRRDAHVAACPACRDDLRDFSVLQEEPAQSAVAALVSAAVVAIRGKIVLGLAMAEKTLQLLESTLAPAPTPVLAPARGEAATAGLAMAIPFHEGTLELQWAFGGAGATLCCKALGEAPRVYRVVLANLAGAALESRTADEDGLARFADVTPGGYLLRAYGPQSADPSLEVELDLRAT
jgi:hypothetical protein